VEIHSFLLAVLYGVWLAGSLPIGRLRGSPSQ
jgi:hypothetical protein